MCFIDGYSKIRGMYPSGRSSKDEVVMFGCEEKAKTPVSHDPDLLGSGPESGLNWDGGPASVAETDRDRDREEDIITAERTWRRDTGMERGVGRKKGGCNRDDLVSDSVCSRVEQRKSSRPCSNSIFITADHRLQFYINGRQP